jgi:catechol 2,3-dioxygenase-like lactoylglutathione lyase family enzyme
VIDHVSVPVRSLEVATRFYEGALAALGYGKLVVRAATIGFGKRYPEFWINLRLPRMSPPGPDCGAHVCLRARSREEVDASHAAGLALGGSDDGPPGPREHDSPGQIYYAACLRDPDGNRIEAVTFVEG